MQINLYTISKRKNSTGLPTGSPYTITCVLKENTDVLSPSFLLQDKPTLAYNYLEWQGLYYWINDITYETNNLWRIDCSIDVLASYRTDILATSCFLEYASGGNTRLVDPRLAKQINAHEIVNSSALPSAVYDDAGTLIMNVVGYGCSGAVGIGDKTSANIVKMILDQASNWYDQLSNFDTSSVEEAIKSIGRIAFSGDVNGAIRGLYWVPMNPTQVSSGNLFLGLYDTGVGVSIYNSAETYGVATSVSVPHAPNKYQQNSQYSDYNLYIPFIGNIPLSADILADEDSLTIEFSVAPVVGDFTCLIKTASGKVLGTYGSTIRVDIPLGVSGMSMSNIANSITTMAGSIKAGLSAGGEIGGVVGGVVGGISGSAGALLSVEGSSMSVGGLGSASAIQLDRMIRLTLSYWDYSDGYGAVSPVIGNPFFKVDTIGNHTYVKTGGGSVATVGYGTILEKINMLLGGGIYVE